MAVQWNLVSRIYFVPGGRSSNEMFVNRNYVYWAKVTQQMTLCRGYSQLVANRCCRLACSLLDTFFSENLFVMRGVRERRFRCIYIDGVVLLVEMLNEDCSLDIYITLTFPTCFNPRVTIIRESNQNTKAWKEISHFYTQLTIWLLYTMSTMYKSG
jgi:hypothetical protein